MKRKIAKFQRELAPGEFVRRIQSLYGSGSGWQSRAASGIGVSTSTITRWIDGHVPVPTSICLLIQYMEITGKSRSGAT